MHTIIGRTSEIKALRQRIDSKEAEFIAIYGRRRVGKTFLIRQVIQEYKCSKLELSGIKNGSLKQQLANFITAMAQTFNFSFITQAPKNWKEAFNLLTQEMMRLPPEQKIIVFFDELPWLATPKSEIIQQLDYFWNNYWSKDTRFKLIVCGSAASWMLEKLILAKGGLYNRITKTMLLQPFTLHETEAFLHSRSIKLNRSQILELYMVMGGIPHYLKHIDSGKSASQIIDQLCFSHDGILFREFMHLFESLFDAGDKHEQIVTAIASKRYGISRKNLLKDLNIKSGGNFEKLIRELEASGFIKKFIPYAKSSHDQYFKVIDEYTLFYLQWIAPLKEASIAIRKNYWHTQINSSKWQIWGGYAYESVCYKHINQIILKLGLENIGCKISNWRHRSNTTALKGAQIDLLFDRDDNAITLCEIKFNNTEYTINKEYALDLLERNNVFKQVTKTKKQLFTCFITKENIKPNLWSEEIVDQTVSADDLF